MYNRRQAIHQFLAWSAAGPLCRAQQKPTARLADMINVMDFVPVAKSKLDPIAFDYLEGGSEDEASLADNRAGFNRIVIRPRALVDVHQINLGIDLFGKKLDYPILLDPAGGKNCFFMDGENVVARAAGRPRSCKLPAGAFRRRSPPGRVRPYGGSSPSAATCVARKR